MRKWISNIMENSISTNIAIVLSFCMPLFPKLLPLILILFLLSIFLKPKDIKLHLEFKNMTFLFAITYLFYVFGLLHSENISGGLFILEVKLSFIILPLFFLFHGSFKISGVRWIYFAFVAGCFINTFFGFYKGYQCYLEKHWWECFFTGFVSYNFHTTYLSIYFCFSILILIYYWINFYSRLNKWTISIVIFLIIYFTGFVVMLSSKGGLIALVTVLFVSLMYYFYKKGNMRSAIIILTVVTGFISILFVTSDYAKIRFNEAFKVYQLDEKVLFENYKETTESTAVRRMIWHVASELISKNPLGVGTGDSQKHLLVKYNEYGMSGAANLKLNCHNQYYETTLAIGIPGLFVLLLFLVYLLYMAISKRNFVLLWMIVIIMINLFFESMFETQAGVIFFVFFTLLLLTSVPEIIPLNNDETEK